MAYKPSERRSSPDDDTELNILPMMNLMCVLIPALLSAAEFVKFSMIEINLPAAAGGGGGDTQDEQKPPEEEQRKLDLTIVVTDKGFTVATPSGIMEDEAAPPAGEEAGPTIPNTPEGEFDYATLNAKIFELKKKIEEKGEGYFVDSEIAGITAESEIPYTVIVFTIDALRSKKMENGTQKFLFPNVIFKKMI